jgi:DUF1365 family protein
MCCRRAQTRTHPHGCSKNFYVSFSCPRLPLPFRIRPPDKDVTIVIQEKKRAHPSSMPAFARRVDGRGAGPDAAALSPDTLKVVAIHFEAVFCLLGAPPPHAPKAIHAPAE